MPTLPYIPEYVTVHLGRPDSRADNVTVSFTDYIKNVASSEIYPTWPEAALRANIYAQTSFALNRIFTEWYRSRGYDFDITSSTAYDQSFVYGRDIFDNISRIVDEQFNSYITRGNNIEPLFAAYCDGVQVQCEGLSQTGTVTLANRGFTPLQILRYYYGNDVGISRNAPVLSPAPSFPGRTLRRGDVGNAVRQLQIRLNRISNNYPGIPKIPVVNGEFAQSTEEAVRVFQRVFGLTEDGVVGFATWYRIAYIYTSVKRLAELRSEGLSLSDVSQQFPEYLRRGDSGANVRRLQYFLAVIGGYYNTVRPIVVDGTYGDSTENAVRDFQTQAGLTVDGIVGPVTWRALYAAYIGINALEDYTLEGIPLYPGETLAIGSTGEEVRQLQTFLRRISQTFPEVPSVEPDGIFGTLTNNSVIAFQNLYGIEPTGIVGPLTWDAAATLYTDLTVSPNRREGQYAGEIS